MKTIAVSIDESLLIAIDRMARERQSRGSGPASGRRKANRSEVVRRAVEEYLVRHEKQEREARERRIFAEHRARLERQLEALVAEQARS